MAPFGRIIGNPPTEIGAPLGSGRTEQRALRGKVKVIARHCAIDCDLLYPPVMARIVNSRCVLAVRDLEVSTRYYVDILGFRKDPIDAAGWSFLTRDRFRVMLGECADERPADELGNHSYFAYWNVEGVDELHRELVAKRAIVTSQPTDKPWGLREFGLSTPDGHRIVCDEVI